MMLGSKSLAVLVALLGALLLAPTAPARGAAAADPPRIDRLTGRVLHTADGDTFTIPVAKRLQNSLELLGKVRAGWLVAYHWRSTMLIVDGEGGIVRRIPYGRYEEYPGNAELELSGDGTRVAVLPIDRGDQSPAVVLTLTGRVVARHIFTSYPTVLAKEGRTFYLAPHRGLLAWHPGASLRRITTADVRAVDLGRGLILRDDGQVRTLATLRHPDGERWTTSRRLTAPVFAPDGRHLAVEVKRRVEVVSVRDGSVVQGWRFGLGVHPAAKVWEDSRHLLVELGRDDLHTLVRCDVQGDVDGSCVRLVPWQTHPLLYWDYTKTR